MVAFYANDEKTRARWAQHGSNIREGYKKSTNKRKPEVDNKKSEAANAMSNNSEWFVIKWVERSRSSEEAVYWALMGHFRQKLQSIKTNYNIIK